jgi:hypothetical protein
MHDKMINMPKISVCKFSVDDHSKKHRLKWKDIIKDGSRNAVFVCEQRTGIELVQDSFQW